MEKTTIKIQKINKAPDFKGATLDETSGAILLRSTWKGRIAGQSAAEIGSGLAIEIPAGHHGLITNSENIVGKFPLFVRSTSIDSSYRGEIKLYVINYSPYPEEISFNQVVGKLHILPKPEIELKGVAKLKKVKTGD